MSFWPHFSELDLIAEMVEGFVINFLLSAMG